MKAATVCSFVLALNCATTAFAEAIVLEHVHLCCGACLKGAEKALTSVDGISEVKCDKDAQQVIFTATDNKVARKALRAFTKAGFYGTTSLKFKLPEIDAAATSDSIKLTGIHLCCAGCTKAVEAALGEVEGVTSVKQEGDKKDVAIIGSQVRLVAVMEALHKAGFHGSIAE